MVDPYRQYFEGMPCYLSVHDRDFRIVEGNRRFREDFGDRVGEHCFRVYKRRDEVCPDCPVEATFTDGAGRTSEQLLMTRAGTTVPVVVHTTAIRDAAGNITSVMEMHDDQSDLLRLKNQVERYQDRLAQLFEEVPCFLTVQGADLKIQHANRRFRETFGRAVGEHCYKVYKHRDEPCLVCQARQALADGEPKAHEEVVTSEDGRKMNVLCSTTPIFDANGKARAVIEMSTDITQLRELQSQLTSVGLLVGSISHGIKGLLTGLDGGIYLVNTGFDKDNPTRIRRGWEMVQRNVDRIRSMVMDILYYAKDRELALEDVDPAAMVKEFRSDLEKKAGDIDVTIDIDIARDVGTLRADAMAVRAMLLNILENSLDACRADNRKQNHRVSLAIRREPPHVVFEIADDGIGMDRETKEKIFSLFFSSKGIKGTGLGLFISNKIADKHGGSIEVDSEPGRGARFFVHLPIEARPSVPPVERWSTERRGNEREESPRSR